MDSNHSFRLDFKESKLLELALEMYCLFINTSELVRLVFKELAWKIDWLKTM